MNKKSLVFVGLILGNGLLASGATTEKEAPSVAKRVIQSATTPAVLDVKERVADAVSAGASAVAAVAAMSGGTPVIAGGVVLTAEGYKDALRAIRDIK